jgi:hypothetical protein
MAEMTMVSDEIFLRIPAKIVKKAGFEPKNASQKS